VPIYVTKLKAIFKNAFVTTDEIWYLLLSLSFLKNVTQIFFGRLQNGAPSPNKDACISLSILN